MHFSVIGDSNYRDLFASHKEEIEKAAGGEVRFDLASSVASVRSLLENPRFRPDILFIASPTNEIALKSQNNTRNHSDIIKTVVTDFLDTILNNAAKSEKEKVVHVIMRPFLRLDPPWLEGKMSIYNNMITNLYNKAGTRNVFIGSDHEIISDDLKSDTVHLGTGGLRKLVGNLIKDIEQARKEYDVLMGMDTDFEDVPLAQLSQSGKKTPRKKKRTHGETSEEENSTASKSKKKRSKDEGKLDSVLDKLDLLVNEMRRDRSDNKERFEKIEDKLEATLLEQANLKEKIETISTGDNTFSASVREDLDAIDNCNLRDTIIIKKLQANCDIPTDRKALSALILETGKKLLRDMLGSDEGMKYIAPLYFKNDRQQPRNDSRKEYPPFKITFKNQATASEFKEKAIKASKIDTHQMYKSYVSNQQNVGTRVRLTILWGIAEALKKEKNKDCWVTQGAPKPTLQIKQAGQTLVRSLSYIEAVTTYGDKIEQKVLDEARKLATRFFTGQVEKVFIIIKD
jgi:hypothetical protein